jgi:DNA polymerase-3 subunit delta
MIHFFTGDNHYELQRTVAKMVRAFTDTHGDLAIERFDGEEASLNAVVDAIQSVPFLASNKMVIVSNVADKLLIERLLQLEAPETTDVIVIIPKVDKRSSYYKQLAKHQVFKVFEENRSQNLPAWVGERAREAGGVISGGDARYLVERVGSNQSRLDNEIQKLITFSPKVTRKMIDDLCEPLPQTTVFQLMDAAFSGNLKHAERIYAEQRTQKVEPHAILGMLAWQLHILAIIKLAGNKSPDMIAKEAKINPFVVKKSLSITKRLSIAQIKELLVRAQELDVTLKSKSVNADDALQNYIVRLATI